MYKAFAVCAALILPNVALAQVYERPTLYQDGKAIGDVALPHQSHDGTVEDFAMVSIYAAYDLKKPFTIFGEQIICRNLPSPPTHTNLSVSFGDFSCQIIKKSQ